MKRSIKRITGAISFIAALGLLIFAVIYFIKNTEKERIFNDDAFIALLLFLAASTLMVYICLTECGILKRNIKRVTGWISFIVALGMVCMVCLMFIFNGNDSKSSTEIANPIRSFLVQGKMMDIPASEGDKFVAKYPNVKEYIGFKVGNETMDIPKEEVDRFLMEFKDAKPLPGYVLGKVAPVVSIEEILAFIALICTGISVMIYVILTKFGNTKLNESEFLKHQRRQKGLEKILVVVLCTWCFIHTFLLFRSFPFRDIDFYTYEGKVEVIKLAPSEKFYPFTFVTGNYFSPNPTEYPTFNFDLRFYDASEYFVYVGGIFFIYFLSKYLKGSKNKMITKKESYTTNI